MQSHNKENQVKRAAFILALMLVGLSVLSAQITSYYSFSATTETYAAITGTSIPTALGDNVISNPVDIGFDFAYGTNTYSQVKVSSNGYVTLGTAPGSSPNNALVSNICPVLAPLWDDNYLQGSAQWLLSGTAPNRVFTIQFTSMKWPKNTPTLFNLQVRLHENSTIEFLYGPGVGTPTNASASIGINMLPGSYENFYSVTPGNPAIASQSAENASVNVWPGTNTKYVFSPPTQFSNDLAALTIEGNHTPTAGVSYTYQVTVHNAGTAAQSNYNVRIVAGTTVLASVAGPAIAPGVSIEVPVSWAPTTEGLSIIAGEVVLTGDEDTSNNLTLPLEVIVQAEGTTAITIGDGVETARKPVDMSYLNSMFQTIFPASEITLNGTITGLSFYNNFTDHRPNMPTKIWLGTTTQTNLSSGWIPAYQMTQVFNGNVNYPHGQNLIHISFNPATPFNYTGGNLVMLVNRPLDTNYYSASNVFYCQTVGSNRSRNAYSDATVFDPNNMGTAGTASGQFPKTTFYMVPAAPEPSFSVDPESHNFGQVLLNQARSQVFQVSNAGGGTLNISSISVSGSPYFILTGLPTLPVALNSGQTTTFSVQYLPGAEGAHTGTISITDDLARLVHTVALSGTGFDPTMGVIPYNQNFDTVTAPVLPLDWQKITLGSATVTTVTNSPFSAPNCVLLNNSTSVQGPYLIAPPVPVTVPVNTLRVRFRAKAASGFSLNLGVMSNPLNPDSFTPVQNLMLASQWTEYMVDMRTYSGTGQYLAFRHNQGGNNRSIYIDNVVVEPLLLDDLAALSISGEITPSLGTAYNYAITVYNWGLNAQDDYQVKLFKTGDIEVASTSGPYLAGNGQATVIIPWAPDELGSIHIYGKVVLAGDQLSSNDQTPNLSITVQESTTTLVVVGSGNQSSNLAPVQMDSHSSLYQNIYRQDELTHSGLISMINFYNNFLSIMPPQHTKIWLGMTQLTDLSDGWIPASQLSLVYDSEVTYPSGVNTISIALQQPFTLLQGYNLVMMVQRPYDEITYSTWDNFFCQSDTAPRARVANSYGDTDPENPPAGTFTAQFPKTGFYITPGGAGNLSGTVYGDANQPLAGAMVTLLNGPYGNTDANGHYAFPNLFARDYTITASAHGYDELIQYVSILPDSSVVLDFNLIPTQTVVLSGTVTGSDDPTVGLPGAQIVLSGYDEYEAVCDAQGNFSISGVYAGYTYFYTVSATGHQEMTGSVTVGDSNHDMGTIVLIEITYPPTNVNASVIDNYSAVDVRWLAPNPEPEDRSIIGYQVWRLLQGQQENEAVWTMLTPQVITQQRFTDNDWDILPQGFYLWAVKTVYTGGYLSSPVFSNVLETTGTISGIVRNEDLEPLAGATISTGTYSTTSAADGSYALHLPSGTYAVSCAMNGYYVNTQYDVVVVSGQTTTLDFTVMYVDNDDAVQITATRLHGNYPNPFNPRTTIRFDLKEASPVTLDIYNLKGQLIRRLVDANKVAGHHSVVWDGRDAHGNSVASGIYQSRIKAGSYLGNCRMTLRK